MSPRVCPSFHSTLHGTLSLLSIFFPMTKFLTVLLKSMYASVHLRSRPKPVIGAPAHVQLSAHGPHIPPAPRPAGFAPVGLNRDVHTSASHCDIPRGSPRGSDMVSLSAFSDGRVHRTHPHLPQLLLPKHPGFRIPPSSLRLELPASIHSYIRPIVDSSLHHRTRNSTKPQPCVHFSELPAKYPIMRSLSVHA